MRWPWCKARHRDLERAQRQTVESTARAKEELDTSRARLTDSLEVADRLRQHNAANRYDSWLEQILRGAQ
ncbi:DUF7620 family protein [Streptomyces kaempferi]